MIYFLLYISTPYYVKTSPSYLVALFLLLFYLYMIIVCFTDLCRYQQKHAITIKQSSYKEHTNEYETTTSILKCKQIEHKYFCCKLLKTLPTTVCC